MPKRTSRGRILIVVSGIAVFAIAAAIVLSFVTAPRRNMDATHFDCILILGTPAERDGTPSRPGRWLVAEAVREYRSGRAAHIVISGAAVANRFVEADVLARLAKDQGVPTDAIVEDRRARDTLQNVENTAELMKQRGWSSVEVIGLPEHLHRTGVLLSYIDLQWSTHAAPTPGRSVFSRALHTVVEACGTAALRVFGLSAVPVLHRLKTVLWRNKG